MSFCPICMLHCNKHNSWSWLAHWCIHRQQGGAPQVGSWLANIKLQFLVDTETGHVSNLTRLSVRPSDGSEL